MNGVYFGDLHSYDDLNLILTSKTISTPETKTETIDITGGDGVIDYTEYFGDIKYKNRKLTFEFSTIVPQNEFLDLFSTIANNLHGKRKQITLDDDANFYYYGRINVNEWKSNKRIGKITIEVDAEPYKYKQSVTTVSNIITTQQVIDCTNLRKAVVPKMTVSSEVTVTFGTYIVVFSGERTDSNIVLVAGHNYITVAPTNGAVEMTFEYQEGGL